mmetsp:Transcript_1624/g.3022  ORF Transcript_1624/g.3022 Transcript_1624/m.3022 type:complete len:210 (+) Transcript_1624:175-804(+)
MLEMLSSLVVDNVSGMQKKYNAAGMMDIPHKIQKAFKYPWSSASAWPKYPETVPPILIAAVVRPNVIPNRPVPPLISLVTKMYMVPNVPAPTPSKICVERVTACHQKLASPSPRSIKRPPKMAHRMGTMARPIKKSHLRPYRPEYVPQIFAAMTMTTCATEMHIPLIKIPTPPLPMARVCMTRGRTVPLERWKRKQTKMKMRRMGSRRT